MVGIMKKSWLYTIIALVAAGLAVAFAFLAGKQYYDDPDPDPDTDPDEKDNPDDKE
jgi:hypothetical protein